MLELGQTTEVSSKEFIFDADEGNFMNDVIEASKSVPIIVDFWAPWCGPCKTLGPQLEEAVVSFKGAVKMAKVNVDENQMIAGQLRVQSIPTVYAFWQGQPIDAFQGALSVSEIRAFVEKAIVTAGGTVGGGLDQAVAAAEELLSSGEPNEALQAFEAVLEESPNHAGAYGGLVRGYIALKEMDQAEAILNGAPAEISETAELETAFAQLQLAKQSEDAGPLGELLVAVSDRPEDHQARLDLAQALYGVGKIEDAVAELLELFRRDRDWNDGAARTQLLIIFEALKSNDPIVLNGRRKLSSLIFA
ncbi:MAG: co-chaperone YbbN [Rhodobacteraceae bacterium]|nr:co-chaperone YbbN [Paracoccaceae bacterium]